MKVIFDFHEIDSLSIAGSQLDHLYLREWHSFHQLPARGVNSLFGPDPSPISLTL